MRASFVRARRASCTSVRSFLLLDRSIRLAFPTIVISLSFLLSSPSRYDPSLPISSLVPQEQDFSIYHSSVIPFEQRTLGFLFLRRNDDTDREIRGD